MNSAKVAPVGEKMEEKMEEGEMDAVPKGAEDGMDNAAPVVGMKPPKVGVVDKVIQILVSTVEKDKLLEDARLEKNVPVAVLVPVWMIGKMVFLFVLAYLTATMTQTDQVKMYLSPIYVFGSSSDYRLCELIPSSFSGTFLLDSRGNWQGTTAFEGGKAKYLVTFNDFSHTYKEYYEILSKMKAAIALVASEASTSPISINLLKFMSYAWVYADGQVNHVLRFVADPADVFNKQYMRAALLSRLTPCGATPTVDYDSTTGDVAVRYDIYSFASIFNPSKSLKGCCSQGTLYTNIGSPATSAVEISSTWGKAPTVAISQSDTRSFGFTTTATSTTAAAGSTSTLAVTFAFSGIPIANNAVASTKAHEKLVTLTTGTSSLLLCSDVADTSKCVTITGSSQIPPLPAAPTGSTLTLSGALSSIQNLYLVDVSTITAADLATVKYSASTTPPSTSDKMGGFKSVETFPSATKNSFGYKGYLENLLGTGNTPDYLKTCLINPSNFGYDSNFDTAGFDLRYNIRSVITAVAVNNDLLPLSALQEVYGSLSITGGCVMDTGLTLSGGVCQLTFNGDTYTIRTYIDPKYDSMDPIYCLARTTSAQASYTFTTMCLLRIGLTFVYPYFQHMGLTAGGNDNPSNAAFYDPSKQCSCADATYDPNYLYPGTFGSNKFAYKITGSSSSEYCNVMDLMHGFVIMSDALNTPSYSYGSTNLALKAAAAAKPYEYKLQKYLQMASANTAVDIAKYAYVAGFTALRVSYGIQVFEDPTSVSGWKDIYSNVLGGAGASTLQFCNGYPLGMNTATDGTAAVLAHSGVGGESSTTLTVLSSTANAVMQDGMSVTWTGSSGIVTLSGCSISSLTSAGTCTMSSARSLPIAVFTASAGAGQGGTTKDTLLTISAVASGTVSNGTTISGTGITGTVTLSSCGAQTCTMSSAQAFSSTRITAAATVTGTFSAVFVATTNGGAPSTTLSITSSPNNDAIYNGGTITTTTAGVTGTVTLSNCQLLLSGRGTGTCTMSSPQAINAGTAITVTHVALFTASAGTGPGTLLTISAVASGTVSNGMTIAGTGITGTVTLSNCQTGPILTCTMSSPQAFSSVTITGTSSARATGGSLSTTLTIISVSNGVVANGMRISLTQGTALSLVTLSGCSVSSTGAGTCTLSSGQIFSSSSLVGSPVDLSGNAYNLPDCTIYAMNTYDKSGSVNRNHLALLSSHCADEFSMPDSSWSRNSTWRYDTNDVPIEFNEQAGAGALFVSPKDLVQSYYVCYSKLSTSLSAAFGSAVGTAGIATAIAFTLMITIVTTGCSRMTDEEKRKAGSISQGAVLMMGAVGAGIGVAVRQ